MDVDIFGSKDNAQKTFDMVEGFLVSYIKNKSTMPIQEWLVKEMSNSGVWGDELESIADIIIEQAALRAEIRLAYEEHINSGKSEESFIAGYIEKRAKELGITNEEAAKQIDSLAVSFDKRLETEGSQSWNDFTKIENAKLISGKAYAVAMIGAVRLAKDEFVSRFKNTIKGEPNPSFQEALHKIIINAGAQASDNVGINIAITAGFMSAAKSGFVKWMDTMEEKTEAIPPLHILVATATAFSHASALAIDTARVGYYFATGKISIEEAGQLLKASVTTQNIASLGLGLKGAMIGSAFSLIPIVGPLLAPATIITGATVGMLLGSKIGKLVDNGIEKVKDIIGEKTVEKISNFASQATKKATDFIKNMAFAATSLTKNIFSKIMN